MMGLFYKVTRNELFKARNEIFVKNGICALKNNGFEESPYNGMRFGRLDAGLYAYDLCRLNKYSHLETITTYISKGDKWIKVWLNIFEVTPTLKYLDQLKGLNGIQFHLPPNSITAMRLRSGDFKGMPLFNLIHHKIKSFYTKRGYQKTINELSKLIADDLNNIDSFVKRWYELHQPMVTDWEGKSFFKK